MIAATRIVSQLSSLTPIYLLLEILFDECLRLAHVLMSAKSEAGRLPEFCAKTCYASHGIR